MKLFFQFGETYHSYLIEACRVCISFEQYPHKEMHVIYKTPILKNALNKA